MWAAAQGVPAAEGSDASVRCFGTNGWQSRWLWQRRRTTPHGDRTLPHGGAREVRSTTATESSSTGARPGILAEPRPQRSDRLALGLPVLAEASGDVIDSSTNRFLMAFMAEARVGVFGVFLARGELGNWIPTCPLHPAVTCRCLLRLRSTRKRISTCPLLSGSHFFGVCLEDFRKIWWFGKMTSMRMLVLQWIHAHASVYGGGDFTHFLRENGLRIPRSLPGVVHTWKSGHYFHGPLVSGNRVRLR